LYDCNTDLSSLLWTPPGKRTKDENHHPEHAFHQAGWLKVSETTEYETGCYTDKRYVRKPAFRYIKSEGSFRENDTGRRRRRRASAFTLTIGDRANVCSGFLVLKAPAEISVVDVYLGEERTLVQLPAKLARGLAALLLQGPGRRTIHTPADNALWQTLDLDGWWDEIVKTETVSGGKNRAYHVTESLSLPEIGLDRFNAFKEWVKGRRS
jgi:hypothetical protein